MNHLKLVESPEPLEMPAYAELSSDWPNLCEILSTSRRLDVAQAAAEYRVIYDPQKGPIKWKHSVTPYLVEPMMLLTSRRYRALILCAPAQSGKTECILNLAMHTAVCQPRDMMVVEKSTSAARDFSKRRLDRTIRYTPEMRAAQTNRLQDDNVLEKMWANGSITSLSWPSINELSGRPIPVQCLTDYDRMPMDIDGEGSPFDLARKRGQTFGSSAITYAESSPGFEVIDPGWRPNPKQLHESPPCEGILALYNRGDRRRWMVPCSHCDEYFEPTFARLSWDETEANHEIASRGVMLSCPWCGGLHEPSQKMGMNRRGIWVAEGQHVENGELIGEPRGSDIASFWLPGPAAAFQSWQEMVLKYLQALDEFEATGSEEALKATVNTDQCLPFISLHKRNTRSASDLESRAVRREKKQVPPEARYLTAEIDVQGNRFCVQVFAKGPGLEKWLVDRYDIKMSPKRRDDSGEPEIVDPASYLEDWDALLDVINGTYPLETDPEKVMAIKLVVCDSGGSKARTGEGSVTEKAYRFWRSLKTQGLSARFVLLKGEGGFGGNAIRKSYPDNTGSKKRTAEARGDVPVYMIRANMIKDMLNNDLGREEPGPGFIHFPDWLPSSYYDELTAESRDPRKGWQNPSGKRNEAWDLCYYDMVADLLLKADRIKWDRPPDWAKPQDSNSMVRAADAEPTARRTRGRRQLAQGLR